MSKKRQDYTDSEIMDALDSTDYNVSAAAKRLGIQTTTLNRWIRESDNLRKYIQWRIEGDAVKARDRLNEILEQADHLDPRQMGHVISVCKILLDKVEADRNHLSVEGALNHGIDPDAVDLINKLLGEEPPKE